ncbi:hypothetical protein [Clostridium saccharoperbutylacetonicum]|uniref:hypothetical protein n=1 Tax=Clostridium saccharoperbutylacetonicum TaxID=36745 RepID=UPI0039EA86CA
MKNKCTIYMILFLIVLGFVICRYNIVNRNIPKEYMIDKYCINDDVSLDNISLKINSFKIEQRDKESDGDDNKEAILSITIKNTSSNELNVSDIVESSKLSKGIYYQDYCNVFEDVKKVNRLSVNDEMNLTLKYTLFARDISKIDRNEEYKFYIGKSLYKMEIENKEKEGKLYGKYISLGRGDYE